MKIKPIYWIALGLALALTISVCDGMKISDKYSKLAGQYQEAARTAAAEAAILNQVIADKDKIIALKSKIIADILAQAGQPSPSEIEKDKTIAALKKKNAELAAAGDYKAAYEGAQAEIAAWSEKFTLAEERHAKAIFDLDAAWQDKYDAQVVISDAWKQKYDGSQRLLTLSQEMNKVLVGKVKRAAILGNIKTGVVIAAAGWIVFNAIKGK